MRILIYILILLPFFGYGQKVIDGSNRYVKPGGIDNLTPIVQAYSTIKDTLEIWWTKENADSYTLQRDDNPSFSSPTTLYSGIDTVYTDSGLSPGTMYYYRVKSNLSEWSNTGYAEALPDVLFWGEFTQPLTVTGTTKYAAFSTFNYGTIFNAAQSGNLAGITIIGSSFNENNSATGVIGPANKSYVFSDSTAKRTFSIFLRGYDFFSATRNIINDDGANALFRFTTGGVQFLDTWNVSAVAPSIPSADSIANVWIQKSNDTLKISTDLGVTWGIGIDSRLDDSLYNFQNFQLARSVERVVFDTVAWTAAQVRSMANYYNNSNSIYEQSVSNNIPGLVFTNMDSLYYVDPDYNLATSAPSYDFTFAIGDNHLLNISSDFTAPLYGKDALLVYRDSQLSQKIYEFPQPIDVADSHNTGSIFKYGNRVGHLEVDIHYDKTVRNKPVIHLSGRDFDLANFTEIPAAKAAPDLNDYSQYYKIKVIDSTALLVHQSFSPSGYVDRINITRTDDFQNFDNLNICDTETSTRWLYASVSWTENDTLALFLRETGTVDSIRENNNYFMWSADMGRTWSNIDNTYSKDVKANGGITLAELRDSTYRVITANSPSQTDNDFMFYDPSDGMFYTAVPNGNDSICLAYGRIGEGFTMKTMNPLGRTLVTIGGGNNNPFANRISANTYDVYCHEENGGDWTIVRYRTTDNGDTWTFEETFQESAGKQLYRIYPTLNWHYANSRILTAFRNESPNNHLLIRDIE